MNRYEIGRSKWELDTPTLLLDLKALERNLARMAEFLRDKPARVRPHSKTHKCPAIAWMQLEAGAIGITCAKLGEAEVMAAAGIRDILIANQVVGLAKIQRLVGLARTADIMVAVEDLQNARQLSDAAAAAGVRIRVLIEVDVGMGRCGVAPTDALALAREVAALPGLRLEGIMGYEGHAVMIPDTALRRAAAERAMALLIESKDCLERKGLPVRIVSAGGSGTYNVTGVYPGVTEIQAGSYATMDTRYKGVIPEFENALTVMAIVISARGDHAVIDAGLKTLTPEFGLSQLVYPQGWALVRQSEEHSNLARSDGPPLAPGDRVEIIPSHGCTTINLHDAYHVTVDERVVAVWPIAARGQIQ